MSAPEPSSVERADWPDATRECLEGLEHRPAGVEGKVVFVGEYRPDADLPAGIPCLVIITTRAALQAGPPLLGRRVHVEEVTR